MTQSILPIFANGLELAYKRWLHFPDLHNVLRFKRFHII